MSVEGGGGSGGGEIPRRPRTFNRAKSSPVKIGKVLDAFLDKAKGVRVQMERTGAIEEWPSKVGDAIARVTHPRSVSDSTLVVEVRSSAWLMELNMMRGEILRRVNEGREGALIEKIVFVLGEQPAQPRG